MKDLTEEQLLKKRDSLITEIGSILEKVGYAKGFLDEDIAYRVDVQLMIRKNLLRNLLMAKEKSKELESLQKIFFEKQGNLPCVEEQVKIVVDKKQLMDFIDATIGDITNELREKMPEQFTDWLVGYIEGKGYKKVSSFFLEAMYGKEVRDLVMQRVEVM